MIKELEAMDKIWQIILELDPEAQFRALSWVIKISAEEMKKKAEAIGAEEKK